MAGVREGDDHRDDNVGVFNPAVLSNPMLNCELNFRLEGNHIAVEKRPGMAWRTLELARFHRRPVGADTQRLHQRRHRCVRPGCTVVAIW